LRKGITAALTQAFYEHAAVKRMIPTSQVTRRRQLNTRTQRQLKTLGKSHVVAVVDQTVNVSTAQLVLSEKKRQHYSCDKHILCVLKLHLSEKHGYAKNTASARLTCTESYLQHSIKGYLERQYYVLQKNHRKDKQEPISLNYNGKSLKKEPRR